MPLILAIPMEARLAAVFVLGACLGSAANLGDLSPGLVPACDQPLVAA